MSVYYIVHLYTYVLVDTIDFCLVKLLTVVLYHNIVILYSDRTKFINDDWMVDKGYMETSVPEKDKW